MKKDFGSDNTRILRLMNYCDTQVSNTNDYSIIKSVFSHSSMQSGKGPVSSIRQIAEESSISQASVSRFIKKIGYHSFDDFRQNYMNELDHLYQARTYLHDHEYGCDDPDAISEKLYQRALDNLKHTYQETDTKKLKRIIEMMDRASSVSIFGDDHGLSDFYTFQIDLMARGVPCFLFKNEDFQHLHASSLEAGDIVLFLNVFTGFVRREQLEILRQLRAKKVLMIGFFQQKDDDLAALFDEYILFGKENTYNDGFYSLWFLAQLMSELLYSI